MATLSSITCTDLQEPQAAYGDSHYSTLSRWTLPPSYLLHGSLYSGLSGTGTFSGNCTRVVSKVSFFIFRDSFIHIHYDLLDRCQAVNKDLDDGDSTRRTRELTDILASVYDLKVLHEKHGIHGDIIVCLPNPDSWVIMTYYHLCSLSQTTSPTLTSTNFSPRTYCINSSKEPSKTIL